jgi:hypothetical protein
MAQARPAQARPAQKKNNDIPADVAVSGNSIIMATDDNDEMDDAFERKSRDLLATTRHLRIGRNPDPLPIKSQDLKSSLGLHLGRLRPDINRNRVVTTQSIDMTMLNAYTIRPRVSSW